MEPRRIAASVLTGAALVIVTAVATTAASASESASESACRDFATWQAHPARAALDAMLTASEHAPWHYLGADVAALYGDTRGHAPAKYRAWDVRDLARDCTQ
jgi:hypothetical protein